MLNSKATKKTCVKPIATFNKTVSVTNTESGEVRGYLSIKHATERLNTSSTTITRHIENNNKFNARYLIKVTSY